MNHGGRIISDIQHLLALFAPHCRDHETFDELVRMANESSRWSKAHGVFDRVRRKKLTAERAQDRVLTSQYLFEEIVAKTLYNLSGSSAPFGYRVIRSVIASSRGLLVV